jgi:hypothetical protein
MPLDEDWQDDDDDRPRRRGSAPKSGAVTALGVINIVLGSLVALPGLWLLLRAFFAGTGADMNPFRPNPGRGLIGLQFAIVLVAGLLILLFAGGLIMAGVGVVRRRPWGRILTLVLAGFAALPVLRSLFELTAPRTGLSGTPGQIFVQLVFIVVGICYVVVSYTILLKSRHAADFQ